MVLGGCTAILRVARKKDGVGWKRGIARARKKRRDRAWKVEIHYEYSVSCRGTCLPLGLWLTPETDNWQVLNCALSKSLPLLLKLLIK